MAFSHIVGNQKIAGRLAKMLRQDRIPHTFLFLGRRGIGKYLFAEALASQLLGIAHQENGLCHPDFFVLQPAGKLALHSMASIRSCIEQAYLMPYSSSKRVVVIRCAERMQAASANALLKTLEEPPAFCHFLLLAPQRQDLLPTIVSRSCCLYFQPLQQDEVARILMEKYHQEEDQAQQIAAIAMGSVYQALNFLQGKRQESTAILMSYFQSAPSYLHIRQTTHALHDLLEGQRKIWLAAAQQEHKKLYPDYAGESEKECESAAAFRLLQEMEAIFEQIELFYRNLSLLYHKQGTFMLPYQEEMRAYLAHSDPLELELVVEIVDKARTALGVSVPLLALLEDLFLRLARPEAAIGV